MAVRYYRNGPARALAAPLANATDTSITVDNASGFPSQFPYTIIIDPGLVTEEVCDVTAAVGNILTIARGVDSTTAVAHATGATVWHGTSARDFTEMKTHTEASVGVHGVTGSVMGTGGAQTVTGAKDFTGGLNANGSPVITRDGVGQQFNQQMIFAGSQPALFNAGITVSGAEQHTGTETHSGTIRFSHSDMQVSSVVSDEDDTTSSSSFVFNNAGSIVGVAFTAPPSGRIFINMSAYLGQDINTEEGIISCRVGTGSTLGAGTEVVGPSGNRSLVCGMAVNASAPARLQATRRIFVVGLTPGATYNVAFMMATTAGGTCRVFYRDLQVEPVL